MTYVYKHLKLGISPADLLDSRQVGIKVWLEVNQALHMPPSPILLTLVNQIQIQAEKNKTILKRQYYPLYGR
jgi:hypothetical protein